MSANNGIYVLKTKSADGGFEYRVREVHAIENLFDPSNQNAVREKELLEVFGKCDVIREDFDAFGAANDLLFDTEGRGLEVEYGVLLLDLNQAFPVSA